MERIRRIIKQCREEIDSIIAKNQTSNNSTKKITYDKVGLFNKELQTDDVPADTFVADNSRIQTPKSLEETDALRVDNTNVKIQASMPLKPTVHVAKKFDIYSDEAAMWLAKKWKPVTDREKGITEIFVKGIVKIAKKIKCNPDSLMAIINSESGFKASLKTGLFGCVTATRMRYGITNTLCKMTPEEQLPYIERLCIENKEFVYGKNCENKTLSDGELYALFFVPGIIQQAVQKNGIDSINSNTILVRNTSKYYQNPINRNLIKKRRDILQ